MPGLGFPFIKKRGATKTALQRKDTAVAMKAGKGLTRQQRGSSSKLAAAARKLTAARKKTKEAAELPSVRKRDSSTANETRGGAGATPYMDRRPWRGAQRALPVVYAGVGRHYWIHGAEK
jgi:hypothetical protein